MERGKGSVVRSITLMEKVKDRPSELFLALQGYAVLDNVAMPVIGTPKQVNDTYVQQIVMDAKAAIDKAAAEPLESK